MKKFYTYYLVDVTSETILTSFAAISDSDANRRLLSNVEHMKDKNLFPMLYKNNNFFNDCSFSICETYDEVIEYCLTVDCSQFTKLINAYSDFVLNDSEDN